MLVRYVVKDTRGETEKGFMTYAMADPSILEEDTYQQALILGLGSLPLPPKEVFEEDTISFFKEGAMNPLKEDIHLALYGVSKHLNSYEKIYKQKAKEDIAMPVLYEDEYQIIFKKEGNEGRLERNLDVTAYTPLTDRQVSSLVKTHKELAEKLEELSLDTPYLSNIVTDVTHALLDDWSTKECWFDAFNVLKMFTEDYVTNTHLELKHADIRIAVEGVLHKYNYTRHLDMIAPYIFVAYKFITERRVTNFESSKVEQAMKDYTETYLGGVSPRIAMAFLLEDFTRHDYGLTVSDLVQYQTVEELTYKAGLTKSLDIVYATLFNDTLTLMKDSTQAIS